MERNLYNQPMGGSDLVQEVQAGVESSETSQALEAGLGVRAEA